jgi:hypothetical protein
MRFRFAVVVLALAVMVGVAVPASAGPVTVDAGWYGFCFAGSGSPATWGCPNEGIGTEGNTFTFASAAPMLLKVTDAFLYGDTFDVWIDSVLFLTSAPGGGPGETNPDAAYADPGYSKGAWLLAPGAHSVDIFAAASPHGSGGAYMEVVTPHAAPDGGSSLLLLGMGLAGLRTWRKRS